MDRRRSPLLGIVLAGALGALAPGACLAQGWDGALCDVAIGRVERASRLPPMLLRAVGLVETGRMEPRTLRLTPWPWSIDVGGQGQVFASKAEAMAAVAALQAAGTQSIDVGCMQVNLLHHKAAFASLEEAFDPQANVGYAAQFLQRLHGQFGDWRAAAGAYHSQTPELGGPYAERVVALWPAARNYPAAAGPGAPPADRLARFKSPYAPEFKARLAEAAADRARLGREG